MKAANRYFFVLAVALLLVNGILVFLNIQEWELYYTVNILTFFLVTFFLVNPGHDIKRKIDIAGFVLFGGFITVLLLSVADIVSP